MNYKEIVKQAQQKHDQEKLMKNEAFYIKTIAWFHYLGLLRHNKIKPRRTAVTLEEALKAGEFEPRILELIPAVLIALPEALRFKNSDIPKDLARVLRCIRQRQRSEDFRGIASLNYMHWLNSPAMDFAKRNLDFRHKPRRSRADSHSIGEFIRDSRINLALTQKELAKKYKLSLRVIRDLEQGKLDASLKITNEILQVFGRSIKI